MMPVKNMQEHLEMWTLMFRNQARSVFTDASNLFPWYQAWHFTTQAALGGSAEIWTHRIGKALAFFQRKDCVVSCLNSCMISREQVCVCNHFHNSTFNCALYKLCTKRLAITSTLLVFIFTLKQRKNLPKGQICTLIKYILSYTSTGVHIFITLSDRL